MVAHAKKTPKDQVRALLKDLPDDASLEDIQYHLYVQQKVRRGLDDLRTGKTVSMKDVDRRLGRWLDP